METVSPVEQGVPQGPSLGGMARNQYLWIAGERATTVHRTMMHGSIDSTNLFSTLAGMRQTTEEMDRFSSAAFTGSGRFGNWRKGVYKPRLMKALGLEGRQSLMGTHLAPSSWMSSVDLIKNPSLGSHNMLNLAEGKRWSQPRWEGHSYYSPAKKGIVSGGGSYDPAKRVLTKAEANTVMNSFLKIGTGNAVGANPFGDAAMAAMFKMDAESAKYAGYFVADDAYSWMGQGLGNWMRGGRAMKAMGAGSIANSTALGTAARGVFGVAGVAVKAYNWGSLAYYGAKGAYKGWELYNIKAPLAAYSAVGRQLTRPNFASGDASLLTGVPLNNRMRAVQAIQGSRLNARSALGNEAALLSGHFG